MRINATLIQSATCDEGQFGSHVYEIFLSWVPGVAGMATTYMRIFLPYRFTDDLVQELPALVGVVLAVDGGGEAGVDYAVREDVRDSFLEAVFVPGCRWPCAPWAYAWRCISWGASSSVHLNCQIRHVRVAT